MTPFFFSKASLEHLQNLKLILSVFEQVSGLKINLERNTLSSINTSQEVLSSLALILDCKVSKWPLSYLGLPLGGNPKLVGFWDPVVESISRRLNGWKKTFLSLGFEGGGGDYFNSFKSISHPTLLPLPFQNSNINSLKDREAAKGFPLV